MDRRYIAVIQAGGKGTRMVSLTNDKIPKPMLEINGKPMIQWQIENIAAYGVNEFVIIMGHLGEVIEDYFGDGTKLGVHISYIREKQDEPLGSAGALYYLKDMVNVGTLPQYTDALLIFGDVMFELDWNRMISFHEQHNAKATLLVHPNAHPYDSDLLILDDKNRVKGIDSKNNVRNYWYDNCVNAGLYILCEELLESVPGPEIKVDLEKDILADFMRSEDAIYGYHTSEYVKDAGTPERFQEVCKEQVRGVWSQKCLKNKQKCVFLDRDGTINKYKGLIADETLLELEQDAGKAIKKINESGYLAILVTNQPVVARGMCTIEDVNRIHQKLQVLLGEQGAYLDDIAFCPHHPDKGYPEENPRYKIECNCRKPATGMIDTMIKKYNVDVSQSWFVGDTTIDVQTGKNAGLKTALVKTGIAGADGKYDVRPDWEVVNLLDMAEKIL